MSRIRFPRLPLSRGIPAALFALPLAAIIQAAPVSAAVTITYGYDELDRLISMQRSDGPEIGYGFDAVGNITGKDVTNSPDTDGDMVANFVDPDDDGDGMPDDWEIDNGLDPLNPADASIDSDNDGTSNLEEYNNGTDPNVSDLGGGDEDEEIPLPLWALALLGALLAGIAGRSGTARTATAGLLLLGLGLGGIPEHASADTSGWATGTAELVSPQAAKAMRPATAPAVSALAAPQTLAAQSASAAFAQLAEALENDPVRIYQYVRNNFEYVPYYGALKGPYLTLLDKSGNDFDQAALLVDLLRAAGFTASYQYGTMSIPVSGSGGMDLASWLGTDADDSIIGTIIATGGIPTTNFGTSFTMDRVWVVASVGGVDYALDPAFKPGVRTSGIDLAAAMGYSQSALLSAAGGTMDADSIGGLNESALDGYLDTLTGTLVSELRQNHPNAKMEDIVSGMVIVPDESATLPAALPFAGTPTEPLWTEIPAGFIHTVNIVHGGINITRDIPEIAGRKLSITYVPDGTVIDPPPAGATDFGTVAPG